MTAAQIPAPRNGWRMACRCGVPVMLGSGDFQSACISALEHLKVCPLYRVAKATVGTAVIEVVQTTLWTEPDHYQKYRDLFFGASQEATRMGATPLRPSGGCKACG